MKLSGPVHTKDIISEDGQIYYSLACVAKENAQRVQALGYKGDMEKYRISRLKTYSLWKKLHLVRGVDYISVPDGEVHRDFVSQRIFDWFSGIVKKSDAADILGISRQTLNKLIFEHYLNPGMMPGNKTLYIHSTSLTDPSLLERIDRGRQLANYKERTTVPKFRPSKPKTGEAVGSIDKVVDDIVEVKVNFDKVEMDEHLRQIGMVVEDYQKGDRQYLDYFERMLASYKEGKRAYTKPEKCFFDILEHVNMGDVEGVTYSLMKFLGGIKLVPSEKRQLISFFRLINIKLRGKLMG